MKLINNLFQLIKDLVCKCYLFCSCKSTCIKEQSTQSTHSTYV